MSSSVQAGKREFRKDIRGRGASSNSLNRFEKAHFEAEEQEWDNYALDGDDDGTAPRLKTEFLPDASRSILTENSSPDVGLRFSVNAYRGCEHGCAYCYARPTHEYLGYSAGLDFESKIFVKERAPELLREKLSSRAWVPEPIFMSGITDCYQPIEREKKLTRRLLEVLLEYKNPVGLITKNRLITRDIDLLSQFAKFNGVAVLISLTTLDQNLSATLEPRTSRPQARLQAIRDLNAAGVPVGVNLAPMIPGLTDHEIPNLLKAAREAGAQFANLVPLRLPMAVAPLFTEWLEVHAPLKKEKVLEAVRSMRGGKLNDPRFGVRMTGEGPIAEQMQNLFKIYYRREGFKKFPELETKHFRKPQAQLDLFEKDFE